MVCQEGGHVVVATLLHVGLPWGRFHATPWGRHVNEGQIEWPPSCWRLLRGLYATWQTRAPDLPSEDVYPMLDALAEPPSYRLPPHVEATTRHYLPDHVSRKVAGQQTSTDKVIDAFAVTRRGATLIVRWDIDLPAPQHQALGHLATLMPYLGRADSLTEMWLSSDGHDDDGAEREWLEPNPESTEPTIRLLAPRRPLEIDRLTVRTDQVRGQRLMSPAGAVWIPYRRREPVDPLAAVHRPRFRRPQAVRWSLSAAALPSVRSAVLMADVLRDAAMSQYGQRHGGGASPILAGKDAARQPLRGHRHTHYLMLDEDRDGLIDHAIAYAPDGFDEPSLRALVDTRRLFGRGYLRDFRPCRLGLEAVGDVATAAPQLLESSDTWESFTPFAAPRHRHKNQSEAEFIRREVAREVTVRGLPEPAEVALMQDRAWLAFRRHRARETLEQARPAVGVRLRFAQPVPGPIVIGALSHFGLGLLLPTR